jgi:hypothetical protein
MSGVSGCPINANVPSDILAGGPTIIETPGLASRYLYFVLPGPSRILSICEFQAFQKKPWIWRKLSGIYNAALLKSATQSSTQTSSVYATTVTGAVTGVAKFAVDGLLTNWLTNTAPLTMSVTNGGEPIITWSVDLGLTISVQYVRVFGNNEAALKTNNGNIAFYLGDSADYKWNNKCENGPTDITPTNPNLCISGSANTIVTQNGLAPFTACYLEFTCAGRGRFLHVVKSGAMVAGVSDKLLIGELEVYASKLLDEPTPRAFSATTVYGGSMVLFGGSDSIGFRNNEIRFFDMLRGTWLSTVQALGTSPVSRSGAFFMNIPSQTNAPSSKFLLFGGLGGSSSDVLNDVSVLSLPSCPEISTYGVQSQSCSPSSVCTFTCIAGAIATNPPNEPLVCQIDGSWRGILPPCRFPYPLKPTSVTATVYSTGVAAISWIPPVVQFPYVPLVSYRVKQVPQEIYEDYSLNQFPARIGPVIAAPVGSSYIGGNWWRLLEKSGNVLIPGLNVNSWDFWQGWLRVNSDSRRLNSFDTNDNLVLYRDFPSGIDPAKDWAVEAFVSLDTFNIVTVFGMSSCLAIVNLNNYGGLGNAEMYLCITNGNAAGTPYTISFEQGQGKWSTYYGTQAIPGNPSSAYLRIERDAVANPANPRWIAKFKFNIADAWMTFPTFGFDSLTRGGYMPPSMLRPAVLSRVWAYSGRGVGLYSYLRVSPRSCVDAGSLRIIPSGVTSAIITGLTYGATYSFTVEATNGYGYGESSDPSNSIIIPKPLASSTSLPLLSRGVPCAMSTFLDVNRPCGFVNDGNPNTWTATDSGVPPNGYVSYMMVDLGSPRSIRLVKVIGRQDAAAANINTTNGFTVWVSDDLNFLTYGRQCDPSRYNPLNGLLPGLTQQFPCTVIGGASDNFLSGRYVFIRRQNAVPNNLFELGEFEVYGVAALRTVSLNKPCVLSSEPSDGSGRCGLAVDGNINTFASNNNDAENFYPNSTTGQVTGGPSRGFAWITIDLGISTVISSLTLYARQDETGATFPFENQLLMSNFSVWAGDLPSWYNSNVHVRNAQCNRTFFPTTLAGLPNNATTVSCINLDGVSHTRSPMVPMSGRYLTIQAQP